MVIGLVGEMASGKDVVKKYMGQKYAAKYCQYSTILRDVMDRLCLEKSRENMQKASTGLRQLFGEELLAKVIANDADKLEAEMVVVDGARRMADIAYLKKLPQFVLVKIEAEPKIRYERIKKRNENVGDSEKTFEAFVREHEAEAEKEIPIVMKEAKYLLDNNASLEDLYKQVDALVLKLKG